MNNVTYLYELSRILFFNYTKLENIKQILGSSTAGILFKNKRLYSQLHPGSDVVAIA